MNRLRAAGATGLTAVVVAAGLPLVPAVAAAPARGCQYPPSIETTTSLTLSRSVAQYGADKTARVEVEATGTSRTPRGSAVVTVDGRTLEAQLGRGGGATIELPDRLPAGQTYGVRARYAPGECSRFKRSGSRTRSLEVTKVDSTARVSVGNVERGERPRAEVSVRTATRITPGGEVRVTISQGRRDVTRTLRLSGGEGSVRFPAVTQLGRWDVVAVYEGNDNVRRDRATDTFKVTRS